MPWNPMTDGVPAVILRPAGRAASSRRGPEIRNAPDAPPRRHAVYRNTVLAERETLEKSGVWIEGDHNNWNEQSRVWHSPTMTVEDGPVRMTDRKWINRYFPCGTLQPS